MRLARFLVLPILVLSLLGNGLLLWQRDQQTRRTRAAFIELANLANTMLGRAAVILTNPAANWDDPDVRLLISQTVIMADIFMVSAATYEPVLDDPYARAVADRMGQLTRQLSSARQHGPNSVDVAVERIAKTGEPVDPDDVAALRGFGQALRAAGWPREGIQVPESQEPLPDSALKPLAEALETLVNAGGDS